MFTMKFIDQLGEKPLLNNSGISATQLNSILQRIQSEFTNASNRIFHEILGENVPDIEVRLCQTEDNQNPKLGSFCTALGDDNHLVFQIFDQLFNDGFNDSQTIQLTIYHEMMHAVDRKEMIRNQNTLRDLLKFIQDSPNDLLPADSRSKYVLLLNTLQMLTIYRDEGVTELCSNILTGNALNHYFIDYFSCLDDFRQITSYFFDGKALDLRNKNLLRTIYESAASVMLRLLKTRQDISATLYDKILSGMSSGNYRLTNNELQQLLTACQSLSLYDYIQGMVIVNEERSTLTPILDLLFFCADIQGENNADRIKSFFELANNRFNMTKKLFDTTMENILGCLMPEIDISKHYQTMNTPNEKLKQKTDQLYSIFTHDQDADRKRICQWALSYFFDSQGVIHDTLPIFGTVDDLLVADTALGLLKQ